MSVYETEGRWFKSSRDYQILVSGPFVQRIRIERYERSDQGSIPWRATKLAGSTTGVQSPDER